MVLNDFFDGHVEVDFAFGYAVGCDFEVVAIVGQNLEAPCGCACQRGDGVFASFGGGCCAVNLVDDEFDFGSVACADFFFVAKRWGVVFGSFAAYDFSVYFGLVKYCTAEVKCGLVYFVWVAFADVEGCADCAGGGYS